MEGDMRSGGCPKTGLWGSNQGCSAGRRRGVQAASAWTCSAEPLTYPRTPHVPQPPTSHAVSLPPHRHGRSAEQPTGHTLSHCGPNPKRARQRGPGVHHHPSQGSESSAARPRRPPPPFPGLLRGCGPSSVSRGHQRDAAGERFSLPGSGHGPDGGQCNRADFQQVPRKLWPPSVPARAGAQPRVEGGLCPQSPRPL